MCNQAPVAQVDRALASEAKGRRFKSCRARQVEGSSRLTLPRRTFCKGAGLAAGAAALGVSAPLWRDHAPRLLPAAYAESTARPGAEGLRVLSERPYCAETQVHMLADSVTPTARHFIRDNGRPPAEADINVEGWRLSVDGLVDAPRAFSIAELRTEFEVVRRALVIECAGNGRAGFDPPALGNQWTHGAVGCSIWTGVRLADVLRAVGIREDAVYTAHYGADTHLSGNPEKHPISRGIPVAKAMDGNVLIAFEQNDAPLHPLRGAPLRLVVPGWPGSCSHKWLTRIWVRDQVHDGAKMTGASYRVPRFPVAPGQRLDDADLAIIERMPVKSLITHPAHGSDLRGRDIEVRGHAWSGERAIDRVELSFDFGASWRPAHLDAAVNPGAWQGFSELLKLPTKGYYEFWARATDDQGASQPHAVAWNQKGYLNNSLHRVAVRIIG